MYLNEDFLPSLQERTNRNKEYLTLSQKKVDLVGENIFHLCPTLYCILMYWKILQIEPVDVQFKKCIGE